MPNDLLASLISPPKPPVLAASVILCSQSFGGRFEIRSVFDSEVDMSDAKKKVRGVADIVFLIDVTGSMQPCIDALKNNIAAFVDALSKSDANNSSPISDWRGRVHPV